MNKSFDSLTRSLLFLLSVLLPYFSFAQAPALQWQKVVGGSGGDYVNSAVEASSGGYVFAGTSGSADGDCPLNLGGGDGMLLKLDLGGGLKWIKIFGGSAVDQLPFVSKTKDGGYIAVGYTRSTTIPGYHSLDDAWVVKTDSLGNLQWQKCYGGSGSDRGTGSINQLSDGNYLLCGFTASADGDVNGYHAGGGDAWVVKIDSGGTHNVLWQKCLGGSSGSGGAKNAIEANDGGILVVGYTFATNGDAVGNHGGEDGWIAKLNAAGTSVLWEQCMGGTGDDSFWSIVQLADNSYAINGTSGSASTSGNHTGSNDYWFVNLSANGNTVIWQKCFGGSGTDNGLNATVTSDGKFIATGRAAGSNDGDVTNLNAPCQGINNYNFWQIKFDSSGIIWQKSLGGTAYDGGNMIIQTSDGGYLIGGETSSGDGDVTGIHGTAPYPEDAWIVKLAPDALTTDVVSSPNDVDGIIIYPNPTNANLNLFFTTEGQHLQSVEIFTLTGTKVSSIKYNRTDNMPALDLSNQPNGFYLLKISTENNSFIRNISVIHQ